jgi:hypothetical protein
VRADLTRRSVLAAGGTAVPLLAAGCKGVGALGTPPRPRPEVAVLRSAIGAEQAMIARYHQAITAAPSLAATLAPVLSQHQAHLAALRARLIEPAGSTQRHRAPRPPGPAPAAPAAALAQLAAAEDAAAAALTRRLATVSPSLAQLLASVAASEASHALVLRTQRSAG